MPWKWKREREKEWMQTSNYWNPIRDIIEAFEIVDNEDSGNWAERVII